jgi:hypothetical protein
MRFALPEDRFLPPRWGSLGQVFRPLSLRERVRVRDGWWHCLRPLTPALSRWEREKGTRVSVVSEKTYPCKPRWGRVRVGVTCGFPPSSSSSTRGEGMHCQSRYGVAPVRVVADRPAVEKGLLALPVPPAFLGPDRATRPAQMMGSGPSL